MGDVEMERSDRGSGATPHTAEQFHDDELHLSVEAPRRGAARRDSDRYKLVAFGSLALITIILAIVLATRDSGDATLRATTEPASGALLVSAALSPPMSEREVVCQSHTTEITPGERRPTSGKVMVLNGTIWPARGSMCSGCDMYMENGAIVEIGPGLESKYTDPQVKKVQVYGGFVTPGIVDMHSHAGVYSYPDDLFATQDGNEMTNPTFPQVQARDGFRPDDPAIAQSRDSGVTTMQILPGSGNLMGGQAFRIKLRGSSVHDMIYEDGRTALKMACGENPKRVYGSRHQTPMSRMGNIWLMRKKLSEAAQLRNAQDAWCRGDATTSGRDYPVDVSLQPLVELLRGRALLNVHCYTVGDLAALVHLSHEFSFSISAFHHALEAYKVPELMRENNITVATFSDLWGYKFEAYGASVRSPRVLRDAGVAMALKSDHPVLVSGNLAVEAAKAHYYGLGAEDALRAITRVPAESIAMGHRVGSLAAGMDADFVVWDRYPLSLGAQALHVYIDGVDMKPPALGEERKPRSTHVPTFSALQRERAVAGGACELLSSGLRDENATSYAFVGVRLYPSARGVRVSDAPSAVENATVVVEDGSVTCAGAWAACPVPAGATVYSARPGTGAELSLVAGFIESASEIGQVEIASEQATYSLAASGGATMRAIDGIRLGAEGVGKHVHAARAAGIAGAVVYPAGGASSGPVGGKAGAFRLAGSSIAAGDAYPVDYVGISVRVDTSAGVPAAIASLREYLGGMDWKGANRSTRVLLHEHQADNIAAMLRLQREIGFPMVIVGGAEAHVVAAEIAASPNVSVIVAASNDQTPRLNSPPMGWNTRRARESGFHILERAGVPVALATGNTDNARSLRWVAGLAREYGYSTAAALALITSSPADAVGLPPGYGEVRAGAPAALAVLDGDPLSFEGVPAVVAIGKRIECAPRQL